MIRKAYFTLPALVLSAWGTTFVHAMVTGRLNTLLHPTFRYPALACGVVLLFLAVWHVLFFEATARMAAAGGGSYADSGEGDSDADLYQNGMASARGSSESSSFLASAKRGIGGSVMWLILLVPMLWCAYAAPGSFSSVAVIQRANMDSPIAYAQSSSSSRGGGSSTVPDPSGKPVYQEVSGILDIGDRPELTKLWEGKKVRTVAQFYPGEEDGTFRVVRFFMFCCASDSVPIPVVVRGTDPLVSELKSMDWCDVTGTVHVKETDKGPRAELELETLTRSPRPAEPFLY